MPSRLLPTPSELLPIPSRSLAGSIPSAQLETSFTRLRSEARLAQLANPTPPEAPSPSRGSTGGRGSRVAQAALPSHGHEHAVYASDLVATLGISEAEVRGN